MFSVEQGVFICKAFMEYVCHQKSCKYISFVNSTVYSIQNNGKISSNSFGAGEKDNLCFPQVGHCCH